MPSFHVYLLRCADGSFYTGHTDDLELRMQLHADALPNAYTSSRLPVTLVWTQSSATRQEALETERQIKGWSRAKKEALIRGDWDLISQLAHAHGPGASASLNTKVERIARPSTSSGRTVSTMPSGRDFPTR
ncbi:MAG TPA: GIY-YIG nuclease family protein [Dehalococcoidia bacterium]|nr:GIY-YIG nuclease family protein [Dehalococcoidia bacterium]